MSGIQENDLRSNDPIVDLMRYHCCVKVLGSRPGGGFFVTPRLIVTCAHVVTSPCESNVIELLQGANLFAGRVISCLPHENDDIALIEVDSDVGVPIPLGHIAWPGDALYAVGYPDTGSGQAADGISALYEAKTDLVDPRQPRRERFLHKFKDAHVLPGFSGGPLINLRSFEAIGIVSHTRSTLIPIGGWAIPVDLVFEELGLDKHNVQFGVASDAWLKAVEGRKKILESSSCSNDFRTGPFSPTPSSRRRPPQVAPSRLPACGPHLFGREEDIKFLFDKWCNNGNIIKIIAWGGAGKSALASHWRSQFLYKMSGTVEIVFDWSFYSQGTSSNRAASVELFFDSALRWFGDNNPEDGTLTEKSFRLVNLVRMHKSLLIIDGLEPLQFPLGKASYSGHLKSQPLADFFRALADYNPGLLIITSRQDVIELNAHSGIGVATINLSPLKHPACIELLRALGVEGEDAEVLRFIERLKGHALALTLFGNYVRIIYAGEISAVKEAPLLAQDSEQGGHSERVMSSYCRWVGEGPELQFLRVMGLFDRPASLPEIQEILFGEKLLGFNDQLLNLSWIAVANVIERLRQLGLLSPIAECGVNFIDTHPLIREFFEKDAKQNFFSTWRLAHKRLFLYLSRRHNSSFGSLEDISHLFSAIVHGCHAGAHEEVFNTVYEPKIKVGEKVQDARKLGGFSTDLAVIACFFDHAWDKPVASLSHEIQAEVLNEASFALRALGRAEESIAPLEQAASLYSKLRAYDMAAMCLGNASELYALVGDLEQGLQVGLQGMRISRLHPTCWKHVWIQIAKTASIIFQMGKSHKALKMLSYAESMQKATDLDNPTFYGVLNYRYYDLLLASLEQKALMLLLGRSCGDNSCTELAFLEELETRAHRILKLDLERGIMLHIGLGYLSVARTCTLLGILRGDGVLGSVPDMLVNAEHYLRSAARPEYLVHALRGEFLYKCWTQRFNDAELALSQARLIASEHGFALQELDLEYYVYVIKMLWHNGDCRSQLRGLEQTAERIGYIRLSRDIAKLRSYSDA
jgi:hypothetical protein